MTKLVVSGIYYGEDAGGVKHVRHLLREWRTISADCSIEVFVTQHGGAIRDAAADFCKVHTVRFVHRSPVLGILWHIIVLPILCRMRKYEKVFLPFNAFVPTRKWYGTEVTAVIRDLAEYVIPNKYDPIRMFYRRRFMMPMTVSASQKLIFISDATRKDAERFLALAKPKCQVIHHGRSLEYVKRGVNEAILQKFGLRQQEFLLCVGRLDPIGKNLIRLLEGFRVLIDSAEQSTPLKLVLAGTAWRNSDRLEAYLKEYRDRNRVVLTGYVSQDDLIDLYSAAQMSVFPTLYEGFGHPVIESMSCGCPVVCSDLDVLREVGGHAALYFDPQSERDIARFSWKTTALKTMQFIMEDL